jgi:hypothetical protein
MEGDGMTNHAHLLYQMKRLELTEPEVMHLLTEARIISDNCIRLWDIADPDLTKAVMWLMSPRPDYMASAKLLYQQSKSLTNGG